MKQIFSITIFILLSLLVFPLAGCTSAASATTNTTNQEAVLSPANQLALGTLKLDETGTPISQEQAAELLPLWKALRALVSSDTAASQEIDALVKQIQGLLSSEQQAAIAKMQLSSADLTAFVGERGPMGLNASGTPDASLQATRQARIESGGSPGMGGGPGGGQGGGFGGGPGMGGTHPEGAVPPEGGFGGQPGAQVTGVPNAWRQTTSSGVNLFLVNRVIQLLEAK